MTTNRTTNHTNHTNQTNQKKTTNGTNNTNEHECQKGPDWAAIFKALGKWRKKILTAEKASSVKQVLDPVVTAMTINKNEWPNLPWAVLVSTILSLRTKDDVTRITSKQLLDKAPGPAEMLKLDADEIARLIYPAGFYRNKSASLLKIARILIDEHAGKVPADLAALLKLPGVGRKTANLVLTEAYDMYGICVDIHVHRICNRAGWLHTSSPDKTEAVLRIMLPKRYWKRINGLLVLYGQELCRPLSPYCSHCVITEYCERRGVEKSR